MPEFTQLKCLSFGSAKALTQGDVQGALFETGMRPWKPAN
jgi:hypothetical protein